MKKTLNCVLAVILLTIICGTNIAFAGIVRDLNPSLGIRQEYNDNLFQDHTDKKWDYITTVTPGISYELNPKRFSGGRSKLFNKITLNLSSEIEYYANNTSLNENIFRFLPSLSIDAELSDRLSANYKISRKESLQRDLFRNPGSRKDEDEIIVSWNQSYGVKYRLGPRRFYFDLAYDHSDTWYETDSRKEDNRYRDKVSVVNYIKFVGETFWLFGAEEEHVTYPKEGQTNSVYDRFYTGITGQFTPKISGKITGGYAKRKGKQEGGFIGDAKFKYAFSPRLSFDLGASITLDESEYIDESVQYTKRLSGGINYLPPHFNKRLSISASAAVSEDDVSNNDDDNDDEKEHTINFAVRAKYKMNKKMTLSTGYEYKMRLTDDSANEYRNNIVYVQLDTRF